MLIQKYSPLQHIEIFFRSRLRLLGQPILGALVIVVVFIFDTRYFLDHGKNDILSAFITTLRFITFQIQPSATDRITEAFIIFNIVFSLILVQSILSLAGSFFHKPADEIVQQAKAASLKDHILICGLGRVGVNIAERCLEYGVKAVAIDTSVDENMVRRVKQMNIPVLLGNALDAELLRAGGIHKAKAIIACINNDLTNIEVALAARKIRKEIRIVASIFNEEIALRVDKEFGEHSAFSTSVLAAPTMAAAALSRNMQYVFALDPEDSENISPVYFGVMTMYVKRADTYAQRKKYEHSFQMRVLSRETAISAELKQHGVKEIWTVIGVFDELKRFTVEIMQNPDLMQIFEVHLPLNPNTQRDMVLICGLDKLEFQMVKILRALNPTIRIGIFDFGVSEFMANNPLEAMRQVAVKQFRSDLEQLRVEFFDGDPREQKVMELNGLDTAMTIIAATYDDLTNVRIAVNARAFAEKEPHILLRVFSNELAEKLEDMFRIQTVFSVTYLASATFVGTAVIPSAENAFTVDKRPYCVINACAAEAQATGMGIEQFERQYTCLLLRVIGADGTLRLLDTTTKLAADDNLTIIGPLAAMQKIDRTLQNAGKTGVKI